MKIVLKLDDEQFRIMNVCALTGAIAQASALNGEPMRMHECVALAVMTLKRIEDSKLTVDDGAVVVDVETITEG